MFIALDKIHQILVNYKTSPLEAGRESQPVHIAKASNSETVGFMAPPHLIPKEETPDFLDSIMQFCTTAEIKNLNADSEKHGTNFSELALGDAQQPMNKDNTPMETDPNKNVHSVSKTITGESTELKCESIPALQGKSYIDINLENCKKSVAKKIGSETKRKRNAPKEKPSCETCNVSFARQREYARHFRKFHQVQTCSQCNEEFKGTEEMKKHSEHHKADKGSKSQISESSVKDPQESPHGSLICTLCGIHCPRRYALDRHMFEVHDYLEEDMEGCKICKLTFRHKKRFKEHMDLHNEAGIKCEFCNEHFPNWRSLRSHKSNKHYKRECPECSLTFTHDLDIKVSLTMLYA